MAVVGFKFQMLIFQMFSQESFCDGQHCIRVQTTLKEKDLGLTISADMKVSEQCGIAAAKGNQILGLIRRNIVYKEKELIIPLLGLT